jgi:hypothetical protein
MAEAGRQSGQSLTGSGAPHYYLPTQIFRTCACLLQFTVYSLVYSGGVQLQLTGIFCYIVYIQINLYHIQVHNHTLQRGLARKGVRRPVEEWSEAHLMGGHFRNSLLSDLVFPADASTAVV